MVQTPQAACYDGGRPFGFAGPDAFIDCHVARPWSCAGQVNFYRKKSNPSSHGIILILYGDFGTKCIRIKLKIIT